MKFLKTRDSSGVGHYVDFKTEWASLSFVPILDENGVKQSSWQGTARPVNSPTGNSRVEKKNTDEDDLGVTDSDDTAEESTHSFSAAAALRKAGSGLNRRKTLGGAKKVKLV